MLQYDHEEFLKRIDHMRRIKRVHFVGIGGTGMCGIAEVLLNQGYDISGSDLSQNQGVKRLLELGATVFSNHAKENVFNADVVVVSSAIAADNIELISATAANIPVISRAEMLGEIMRFRYGIAVAGTHGKTTTTSMLANLLSSCGKDPTFVIGGKLNSIGSNAKLGNGHYLVAEADESDSSFLSLQPMIAIVTNIDKDHMATYAGDFKILTNTFIEFLHKLPFYGLAILCLDCPNVRKILPRVSRPVITYGFSSDSDVRAINFVQNGIFSNFDVICKKHNYKLTVSLKMPGRHNVNNALAAIAVAISEGLEPTEISQAMATFTGVGRRFQVYDQQKFMSGNVNIIDDYGHHPCELAATISSVRAVWPSRRLVMVFQPHRYSRTKELFDEFVAVLNTVDILCLLPVYSAGEEEIVGADSHELAHCIRQLRSLDPIVLLQQANLKVLLNKILQDDDILLLQGAGNIGNIAADIVTNGLLGSEIEVC